MHACLEKMYNMHACMHELSKKRCSDSSAGSWDRDGAVSVACFFLLPRDLDFLFLFEPAGLHPQTPCIHVLNRSIGSVHAEVLQYINPAFGLG